MMKNKPNHKIKNCRSPFRVTSPIVALKGDLQSFLPAILSRFFFLVFSALTLTSLFIFSVHASSPGTTAANFLKIGTGARGSAMGEAQVAVANDVTAQYWNPAGLTHMRFNEISVMHYELVEGVRYNQASFGFPTENKGHFAFGLNLLDFGDIDSFDNNSLPTGTVDASNLLFTASWAKKFEKRGNLSFGSNIKVLRSDLAGFTATGAMIDLGVQYPFTLRNLHGLSVAAAIRNLGPGIEYESESSDLPQQIVLGGGLKALGGNLSLALDLIKPKDNGAYFATGLEYRVFQLLNLRVGFNGNSDFVGEGITYGIGLKFQNWNLDYAFVPFGDLGDTNRVSVGVRFGRAARMKSAEDQVDLSYQKAKRQLALGRSVEAYSTISELLLIAPWHKPSNELKANIEKQFAEMAESKNRVRMEAEIAETFTNAKSAFDRDDLVTAKKGFNAILKLQPEHVGATIYLERIKNRYTSLANESFKVAMGYFAAGDYEKAKAMFEKTLNIDENYEDARVQLAKTMELMQDENRRVEEIQRLAGAADAYKDGLKAYQDGKWERALERFAEVKLMVPEYEEVNRYYDITLKTYASVLFEEAKVNLENGQLAEGVQKLKDAERLTPEDDRITAALRIAEKDLALSNAKRSKQLYQSGLEAFLSGKNDDAEKLWNRALELDPSNDEALQALSKLQEQKTYENKSE